MPNSILWIGLVVLWLFVLFPMLAGRHPRIRQTTDAALATRVLLRGGSKRRAAKGPATGHDSDPDWCPVPVEERIDRRGIDAEDLMDTRADEADTLDYDDEAPRIRGERRSAPQGDPPEFVPNRRGRGGFDPQADAIARAARYSFRQRAVLGLVLVTLMTAALGLIVSSTMWWACGAAVVLLGTYLSYLRKQVRMEEEIRRRRMARAGRARLGVESATDEELRLVPTRLRRPGAVVLECDDEDPIFDHLDDPDAVQVGRSPDRPTDRMRRAAGE